MDFVDAVLGLNESTNPIEGAKAMDILVHNLSSGAVKLQFKFRQGNVYAKQIWLDYPDASFEEDVAKIVEVSQGQVSFRLTGVSNNTDVYARLGRRA